MHYTGTIWRPPYEAYSLLLEATAGCTHHKCKFCTLYHDLPFKFRMSPREDIKSDLQEAQLWYRPNRKIICQAARAAGTSCNPAGFLDWRKPICFANRTSYSNCKADCAISPANHKYRMLCTCDRYYTQK